MTGLLYDGQARESAGEGVAIGARQLVVRGDLVDAGADCRSSEERSASRVLDGESSRAHAHARLCGVDGIMSDYPDRLVAAVKKEAESIS